MPSINNMSIRRLKNRHKVAFSISTVIIVFLLLEGLVRLGSSYFGCVDINENESNIPFHVPHPYLCFALNPAHPEVNSHGFYGKEIPPNSDGSRLRIVAIGGSTTFGVYVGIENAYPKLLENILRNRTNNDKIDVINAGVVIYSTFESLINLELRILELKPQIVLCHHAANDILDTRFSQYNPDGFRADWDGSQTFKSFLVNHFYIFATITKLMGKNFNDTLTSLTHRPGIAPPFPEGNWKLDQYPTKYFTRNINNMVLLTHATGAKFVLCTFPYRPGDLKNEIGLPKMNLVIRKIASLNKVPLIDLEREMPPRMDIWLDEIHGNKDCHMLKAKIIADELLQWPLMQQMQN